MLTPLVILAILCVIGGWVGVPEAMGGHAEISHFLSPVTGAAHEAAEGGRSMELLLAAVSVSVAVIGWFIAHLMYFAKPELPAQLASKVRGLYSLLLNKYWVDELYGAVVVAPILLISRYVLKGLFDTGVITGGGMAIGYSAQGLGALVQRVQSGNIRSYAGWLALGAAALLLLTYVGFGTHLLFR
jgi:NADH-quinone oxidoreductase subunit L